MMFIIAGFMILGGIFIMLAGMPGQAPGMGAVLGIIYIVMALIYIVPGIFLWQYATRINEHLRHNTANSLAAALKPQKSFWKFVGICMIVIICIYVVIFVFAIVGGVLSAM